jgi:hypothetical protein
LAGGLSCFEGLCYALAVNRRSFEPDRAPGVVKIDITIKITIRYEQATRSSVLRSLSIDLSIIDREWSVLGIVLGILKGNRMTSEMGMRKAE